MDQVALAGGAKGCKGWKLGWENSSGCWAGTEEMGKGGIVRD